MPDGRPPETRPPDTLPPDTLAAGSPHRAIPAAPHALHHPRSFGAEPQGDGLWRFALWAPSARDVALDLAGAREPMAKGADGTWRLTRASEADAPYAFVVDGLPTPDPMARAQAGPDVMGPSRLLDPRRHAWTTDWRGRPWEEAVLYELHVGAFTAEGTFAAAATRLPDLAALGVTALEVMPIPHFPGTRGWGYDGCLLAAPHPAYGTPDEFRAFVEAAQSLGIMVILDIVLNHVSPEGSDLHRVQPELFDPGETSPWGAAIAYARPEVRRTLTDICLGWLTEYRLDGLRFDAVHEMKDEGSDPEYVVELARTIRGIDFGRPIHLVTEDSRNIPDLREPDRVTGAPLYTAEWNDDFHHAMHCLLTDEAHSYLASFAEDPVRDLTKSLAQGYVETGQRRAGQARAEALRGEPAGHLPWTAFVNHNQNHDQIGNHPSGRRLIQIADPGAMEVAQAMLLLSPFVPMLFMGEEEGERGPFHYFCDVSPDLGAAIHKGRKEEFGSDAPGGRDFPDPNALATFLASRPFTASGTDHARHWRDLTARLLALRHERIVPLLKSGRAGPAEVQRRGDRALSASWPFRDGLLVMHANLGGLPDTAPRVPGAQFTLGDVTADRYALAVAVSAPLPEIGPCP